MTYHRLVKNITAFQITGNLTVCSTACSANNKENVKAPCYWSIVRGIHWSLVDSPHKETVIQCFHDIIMKRHLFVFWTVEHIMPNYDETNTTLPTHSTDYSMWLFRIHQWKVERQFLFLNTIIPPYFIWSRNLITPYPYQIMRDWTWYPIFVHRNVNRGLTSHTIWVTSQRIHRLTICNTESIWWQLQRKCYFKTSREISEITVCSLSRNIYTLQSIYITTWNYQDFII